MQQSSQNNPLVWFTLTLAVYSYFVPYAVFFPLLYIGEAMEIQICSLFSVTALGKTPDTGLEQKK